MDDKICVSDIRPGMKIKKRGYVGDHSKYHKYHAVYWKVLKRYMRNKTWWFYVATAIDGSSWRVWVHESEIEDVTNRY